MLNDAYLTMPDEHARAHTTKAARPTSDRPIGFFFAGQIRAGGRADMAQAINDMKANPHTHNHRGGHSTLKQICDFKGLRAHGTSGCSDVFLGFDKFMESDGLDVAQYYGLMHKTRYVILRGL